jgi:3-methyladenine DNA glycosylase Mpg
VVRTPRIGVGYAGSWALRPWRFLLRGSAWTSGRKIHLHRLRERTITSSE